ncbi:hypothetical protein Tco_0680673 [Tanacetum coccineum]|uniref:Uncharacterized protein n=1 Tax=Tanacetum coccineum TaxID=301880 RepID=A0ABQ4XL58_9ASTR
MFKVFNRCLTTRTSGHDRTKINILQLFHAVINQTNVDYAALLWWDFMNNVFQKKEAIQYLRFIKLMIANLMNKFPDIPQRVDEDYHSIKDDTPLEIHATDDFKEYEMVFVGVDVPMNQPQPVVSTQGTHRLEPESHKENPEYVDDDDDEEKVDEEKDVDTGSLETRTEEMQTPIPTPPRSPRINLSSDKNITQELTDIVPLPTATTSKTPQSKRRIFSMYSHLPDDLIENNLKPSIAATIIEGRDAFRSTVPDLVSQEFNAQAPKIIE